jgi:hypothetical protein
MNLMMMMMMSLNGKAYEVLKCYSTRLGKDLVAHYREDDNEVSGVKQGEKLLYKLRLSISQERVSSKEVVTLRGYRTPTLIVTMLIENRLVSLLSPEKHCHFPAIDQLVVR